MTLRWLKKGEMYDDPAPFPPKHPMHEWHLCFELLSSPITLPLSAPFDVDAPAEVPAEARDNAKQLLDAWEREKLPLTHPETRDWIFRVLGYYKAHYANRVFKEPLCWYPLNIIYDARGERDPLAEADEHVGVHFIRRFYPDYQPIQADFDGAYWVPRVADLRR